MVVRTRVKNSIKSSKVTRGMLKAGPMFQGVAVRILKGKETTLKKSAFLANVAAGRSGRHIGVFRRIGRRRLPIEEKNVISVGSMVSKPEVMSRLVDRITARWIKEFPRQLKHYQAKAGK